MRLAVVLLLAFLSLSLAGCGGSSGGSGGGGGGYVVPARLPADASPHPPAGHGIQESAEPASTVP